jgi:cell division septation protein DedD
MADRFSQLQDDFDALLSGESNTFESTPEHERAPDEQQDVSLAMGKKEAPFEPRINSDNLAHLNIPEEEQSTIQENLDAFGSEAFDISFQGDEEGRESPAADTPDQASGEAPDSARSDATPSTSEFAPPVQEPDEADERSASDNLADTPEAEQDAEIESPAPEESVAAFEADVSNDAFETPADFNSVQDELDVFEIDSSTGEASEWEQLTFEHEAVADAHAPGEERSSLAMPPQTSLMPLEAPAQEIVQSRGTGLAIGFGISAILAASVTLWLNMNLSERLAQLESQLGSQTLQSADSDQQSRQVQVLEQHISSLEKQLDDLSNVMANKIKTNPSVVMTSQSHVAAELPPAPPIRSNAKLQESPTAEEEYEAIARPFAEQASEPKSAPTTMATIAEPIDSGASEPVSHEWDEPVADQTIATVADQTGEAIADQSIAAAANQADEAIADQSIAAAANQADEAVADQSIAAASDQTDEPVVDLASGLIASQVIELMAEQVSEQPAVKLEETNTNPLAVPIESPVAPATKEDASETFVEKNNGWVVNLISFSTRKKADKELARIRELGVIAEIVQAEAHGKTWFRIRAPGFASKQEALTQKDIMSLQLGIDDAWVSRSKL